MKIFDFIEKELGKSAHNTIIEVGAHTGSDTILLSRYIKSGTLLAFEPDPRNIQTLRENVDKLNMPNVKVINEAVGAIKGTETFYLSSGQNENCNEHTASSSLKAPKNHINKFPWVKFSETVKVSVTTLDIYCSPIKVIDLVWLDVQGSEIDVIEGGMATLTKTRFLFTEFNDGEMYEGQLGLIDILDKLPGEWGIIHIFGDEVLLQNKAFGTDWLTNNNENPANAEKLSIVMQGPILSHTKEAIASVRKWFSHAELVLSTWKSERGLEEIVTDKLVIMDDPGGGSEDDYANSRGNMVRLFTGCLSGLNEASHNIVMKIRTDTIFTGNGCLRYFGKWPKRSSNMMNVFKNKIIVPNVGTADPEIHICFQISDWVILGHKEDMEILFNPPLTHNTNKSPEQYMWLNAIRKKYPHIDIPHINFKSQEAVAQTIDFMTNNLVILDTRSQFNFYGGRYQHLQDDDPVNMRHAKWAQWYGGIL